VSVALQTRGLSKRYGRRWALSGCNLEVPAGHVAGLGGPNGAGKTTLLNLAVGLIEPSAGSIAGFDEEVAGTPAQLALAQATVADPNADAAALRKMGDQIVIERPSRRSDAPTRSTPEGDQRQVSRAGVIERLANQAPFFHARRQRGRAPLRPRPDRWLRVLERLHSWRTS
jgi:ABC-type cobalamin/Fe3+-siderophores transport system ATPase subunit